MPTPLRKAAIMLAATDDDINGLYTRMCGLPSERRDFWRQVGIKAWQAFEDHLHEHAGTPATRGVDCVAAFKVLANWSIDGTNPAIPTLNMFDVAGWADRWLADRAAADLDTQPVGGAR